MKKFIEDCKHMMWLFKQMIVLGFKGDWKGSIDAWYWMKIYWNYKSKRIK